MGASDDDVPNAQSNEAGNNEADGGGKGGGEGVEEEEAGTSGGRMYFSDGGSVGASVDDSSGGEEGEDRSAPPGGDGAAAAEADAAAAAAAAPVPKRKRKSDFLSRLKHATKGRKSRARRAFLDDDDDDDDDQDSAANDGVTDDAGGVSLDLIKDRILGRKIVTGDDDDGHHDGPDRDRDRDRRNSNNRNGGRARVGDPAAAPPGAPISPELRQELCCAVCSDPFYHPVSLPCGHSFCRRCVVWWLDRSSGGSGGDRGSAGAGINNEGSSSGGAPHGSSSRNGTCPTCRQPVPCPPSDLGVNTSLRAVVTAFLGPDLRNRIRADRDAEAKARKGEFGGAHDGGYEVLSPVDDEGWKRMRAARGARVAGLEARRSIVLDEQDARMQLALAVQNGPDVVPPKFDGRVLEVTMSLLTMEEDEAEDGVGFPLVLRDEDDAHLVCFDGRFLNAVEVTATAMSRGGNDGGAEDDHRDEVVPVTRRALGQDGTVSFRIDVGATGPLAEVDVLRFRHEETGAEYQLRLPSDRTGGCSGGRGERDGDGVGDGDDYQVPRGRRARDYVVLDASDSEGGEDLDRYEDNGFLVEHSDHDHDHDVSAEEDHEEEEEDENEVCCICREHGELIICDGGDHLAGCGRSYHIGCINREEVPAGDWVCKECAVAMERDVGVEGFEFPHEEGGDEGNGGGGEGESSPVEAESSKCARDDGAVEADKRGSGGDVRADKVGTSAAAGHGDESDSDGVLEVVPRARNKRACLVESDDED